MTNLQNAKLNKCPFCGKNAKYQYSCHVPTYPIGVRCNTCRIEFMFFDKKENLIKKEKAILKKFKKRSPVNAV